MCCLCEETAKSINCVAQVLNDMGIKTKKLAIMGLVDNVGAIFMTENVATSGCTNPIDVRHHYVRELVEEGFIKIIFVKLENNLADRFTKNVSGAIYDGATSQSLWLRDQLCRTTAGSTVDCTGSSYRRRTFY
jgi:hypothetical protein